MADLLPCAPACFQSDEGPTVHVLAFSDRVPVDGTGQAKSYDINGLPLSEVFPLSEMDGEFSSLKDKKDDDRIKKAKTVRVFRFKTRREARVVEIKKSKNFVYILVDGELVRRAAHGTPKEEVQAWRLKDKPQEREGVIVYSFHVAEFSEETNVVQRLGGTLDCKAYLRWSHREGRFIYAVTVEGLAIPMMWSDTGGVQFSSYIPDVVDWERNLYSLEEMNAGNHDWLSMLRDDVPLYSTTRMWRFSLNDEIRGIEVSHQKCFIIFVDGIEVKRFDSSQERRTDGMMAGWTIGCQFPVKVRLDNPDDNEPRHIVAFLRCHWGRMACRWDYELMIGSQYIPPCGYKGADYAPNDFVSVHVPDITPQLSARTHEQMAGRDWSDLDWDTSVAANRVDKTMSTCFIVRSYYFTTRFKLRVVSILHNAGIWYFTVDGKKVEELKHGTSFSAKEEKHRVSFDIPLETYSLRATCEMTWLRPPGEWSYKLSVTANHYLAATELLPLYGPEGCGRIRELIETGKIGLEPRKHLLEGIVPTADHHISGASLLMERIPPDANQIQVEKEYIKEFEVGACIKIEGPENADPHEFRTILGTAPTGIITFDTPFESKHEKGATVKQILKEDMHSEKSNMEAICQVELDHVLKKKLRNKDGNYGIRFFAGETRMGFEAVLAVTIDIAQLLMKFPFFNVKVIGYSAAPSPEDIYKTDEDVEYLALKRCEVIKQLLLDKGVINRIGIESKGYFPDMPACCMIERSDEEDIRRCNEVAEKFVIEREARATDMRFIIGSGARTYESQLALMDDASVNATNGMRFTMDDAHNQIDTTKQVDHSLSRANSLLGKQRKTGNATPRRDYEVVLSTIEKRTEQATARQRLDQSQSYMPNEEVEYFSRTNKRWLSAFVTKVTFDEHSDAAQWFYDLIFARSRNVRSMAEMHSLRKPLGRDGVKTLVEVFSKRNMGTWYPGYIQGYQPSASTMGYNVMVRLEADENEQLLENVPGERIRRRFESGTEIQFYVNGKFGWRTAIIGDEARNGCVSKSGYGVREFEWLGTDIYHECRLMKIVGDTRRVHFPAVVELGEKYEQNLPLLPDETGDEDISSALEPWTLVPLSLDEKVAKEINQARKIWVELWRIRSPVFRDVVEAKPTIIGLDGSYLIDRGGIPRRIVSM